MKIMAQPVPEHIRLKPVHRLRGFYQHEPFRFKAAQIGFLRLQLKKVLAFEFSLYQVYQHLLRRCGDSAPVPFKIHLLCDEGVNQGKILIGRSRQCTFLHEAEGIAHPELTAPQLAYPAMVSRRRAQQHLSLQCAGGYQCALVIGQLSVAYRSVVGIGYAVSPVIRGNVEAVVDHHERAAHGPARGVCKLSKAVCIEECTKYFVGHSLLRFVLAAQFAFF